MVPNKSVSLTLGKVKLFTITDFHFAGGTMRRLSFSLILSFLLIGIFVFSPTACGKKSDVVTTLAGSGSPGFVNGTGTAASFSSPGGVAVDSFGNVYVADQGNDLIRKISPEGAVSTLAGSAGVTGNTDGPGSTALFYYPAGIAVDSSGNVYVADEGNNMVRKITPEGMVTTLAGSGSFGYADGKGTSASFYDPISVAVDSFGNVYVADSGNHLIRQITSDGMVSILAGSAGVSGSTDGTGTAATFNKPFGVGVDSSGNVYVADTYNHLIRKITKEGVVSTLAGSGNVGAKNGLGMFASFNFPTGVAVDKSGNVYVADFHNNLIRKITVGGEVMALALSRSSWSNGGKTAKPFYKPTGIAVDSSGNVYVADTFNHLIRKIQQN